MKNFVLVNAALVKAVHSDLATQLQSQQHGLIIIIIMKLTKTQTHGGSYYICLLKTKITRLITIST